MQKVGYAILAAAVACANDPPITPSLFEMAAREVIAQAVTPLYEVDTISGSLGGAVSIGRSISSRGTVAGVSFVTNNAAREAVLWEKGELVRLGTLGGANSSVQWPGQKDNGMVVGISQTAVDDTLRFISTARGVRDGGVLDTIRSNLEHRRSYVCHNGGQSYSSHVVTAGAPENHRGLISAKALRGSHSANETDR
jgi:uncharacterized membrane protein